MVLIIQERITNGIYFGIPATIPSSIPHSSFPLKILKKPLSPHSLFHELATNLF